MPAKSVFQTLTGQRFYPHPLPNFHVMSRSPAWRHFPPPPSPPNSHRVQRSLSVLNYAIQHLEYSFYQGRRIRRGSFIIFIYTSEWPPWTLADVAAAKWKLTHRRVARVTMPYVGHHDDELSAPYARGCLVLHQ